ncbi:MAG: tetratricopeptide repeat protein [Calditrichaeota bacterium]|nr:MAG: tetratricopeptide repeat protein [Calditrichota bacterium]
MAIAKKLITAQIHLEAVEEFKGELTENLADIKSSEHIIQVLQDRYGNGSAGELSIDLQDNVAQFRWILPRVVNEAEALHKEALARARSHQFREAIGNWIKAISLNPQDPDYYFNTGIAYFEEKNYKESIENLEYTIKLCPIYHKARLILGTIYLKTRKFDKAEYHLKESIYFNPTNPLAILNLGAVYFILKRYDEAIFAFEKVLKLVPTEARAYFGLGKIYSILGQVSQANDCFLKTIELDKKGVLKQHAKRAIVTEDAATDVDLELPAQQDGEQGQIDEKALEATYAEGYKSYLFGDYSRAVTLYRKYLSYKSRDDYAWLALGEAYLRNGQCNEAISAFKNAIKLNSNKGLYYKQLALAYDAAAMADKAIDAAEKAAGYGKRDSIVYTIWGKNLLKQNMVLDAIEKLEQALKLNKANLHAEYHLALAYLKNNEQQEALDHLHWIMSSKVKSPLKMHAEEKKKKIQV